MPTAAAADVEDSVREEHSTDVPVSRTPSSAKKTKFKLVNRWKEAHGQSIYGIQFNLIDSSLDNVFATVGGNRLSIYKVMEDGSVDMIQSYRDQDKQEVFFTCAWLLCEERGEPMIACAGHSGLIKIIKCSQRIAAKTLIGHGGAINEIRLRPNDCQILLSVGKDRSVRIWNIRTAVCIAMFAGEAGHLDEVLSCDWNLQGNRIVSCGMDHTICIWEIDESTEKLIQLSSDSAYQRYPETSLGRKGSRQKHSKLKSFKTKIIQFPLYFTRKVHANYVDSVRFFGEFILSKSVENCICLWQPDLSATRGLFHKSAFFRTIRQFQLSSCDIWYLRFTIDAAHQFLACGNKVGNISVWDLSKWPIQKLKQLSHSQCTKPIRQLSFSPDSKFLVAGCDDSTVWIWRSSN